MNSPTMISEPEHEPHSENNKQLKQRLNLTTERLKHLIFHLRDGLLVESDQRQIDLVNAEFCTMFGIDAPPEALIGYDCALAAETSKTLFVDEDQFIARSAEILQRRELVKGEMLFLKDGRTFERDYVPIFIEGEYSGHLWQYRDLTQTIRTRRRQDRLLEIEIQHRHMLNVFLSTPDVDQSINQVLDIAGHLLNVSRAYVFHFRRNEQILDNTHEWCAPGINPKINNLKGLLFDTLAPSFFPYLTEKGIIAVADIHRLPEDVHAMLVRQSILSLLIVPLYVEGRLDGFVGFDETRQHREWLPEEITIVRSMAETYARTLERQHMEVSLIEARDLALRSAQLKSHFVSNMSHEVRTPLTGIIGMLELLRETVLDEDQHEFAESAFSSAHRLLDILNDVLDFSKLESGQLILNVSDLNLGDILLEVKNTLAPLASRNRVAVRIEISPETPVWVIGDAVRLRQVIMNLTSNAIKFTTDGQVTIRLFKQSANVAQARIRFEVEDTGIGIRADQLDNIFESFVQADGSITRKYGGTGLGLAICKQLVGLMGGSVDVTSKSLVGSTFGFTLTFTRAHRWRSENSNEGTNSFGGLRVLIVDEDNMARYSLAQQVRGLGATVVELDDLDQLLLVSEIAAQKSQPFGAILVGSRQPLEKLGALSIALRRRVGLRLKQLVKVGDNPTVLDPATHAFDDFIARPVTPETLRRVLSRATAEPKRPISSPHAPLGLPAYSQVLIVDDDPDTQRILRTFLERLRIRSDAARDGQQAFEMLTSYKYQLVITDIQMPVMDGLSLIRKIRANSEYADLPVIALTASVMSDEVEDYLKLGFSSVIAKPFVWGYVRGVIREYLKLSTTILSSTHAEGK